jgi:succinoglycan biosynthesis transport protein ExoP
MLKNTSDSIRSVAYDRNPEVSGEDRGTIEISAILAGVRRQAVLIGAFAIGSLILGYVYASMATPLYSATTQLLIDSRKGGTGQDNDASVSIAELAFDTGAIDSQVEVLRSERIAKAVIKAQKLDADPAFLDTPTSLIGSVIGSIRGLFGGRGASPEEVAFLRERALVDTLGSNLRVWRVGRTYVLAVDYTSKDPDEAARLSRAFAEAYLEDQLLARFELSRRSAEWMLQRIQELKKKSLETDLAVQRFRADNGLIVTGATGQLLNEQQLGEVNSQLTTARGETAQAEAKYQRLQAILNSGQADAAVTESLGNSVIVDLRNRYLRASKSEAELSSRLGKTHSQVLSLRKELKEYERLIFDELGRIAESTKSEYEIAKARQKSLEDSLASLLGVNAVNNETLVTLRELEREADTYKNLYQSFLQRYQETIQKQSFPVNEARVITSASKPLRPSYPRKSLIMAIALLAGLGLGGGIGVLREFRDRSFRTAHQIREGLGLEFLGYLSAIGNDAVEMPLAARYLAPAKTPSVVASHNRIMRHVLDAPMSAFAETLRYTKVAIDLVTPNRRPRVIGVVSVLPNEGKTTVSKNLASLIAHLGPATLLVDGDLRNPGLTRSTAPHVKKGLKQVLVDGLRYRDLLLREGASGLDMLPAVSEAQTIHTSGILSSTAMQDLLEDAGRSYDYIVVDLPPLGPVVDARSAAHLFDAFVFVVRWGSTSRDVVAQTLRHEPLILEKTVGVILNRCDFSKIKLYENKGSREYYRDHYAKYYES